MARTRLALMTAGVLLIAAALIGAALTFKAQQGVGVSAEAAAAPAKAGRFVESRRSDFRIFQPDTYKFTPSQATRDLVQKHAAWRGARNRVWYEFVPKAHAAPPLMVLLHGAGRDGLSLVEMWKDVAAREGIALLALDGIDSTWRIGDTDPEFLGVLVDKMVQLRGLDPDRVYLFGHSAGAAYAQYLLNRVEGPWTAAVLHAGYAPEDMLQPPERARPFRLYLGTKEHIFSLETARDMGGRLAAMGHDNELIVIPGHTHWLYQVGPQIAADSWQWLSGLAS